MASPCMPLQTHCPIKYRGSKAPSGCAAAGAAGCSEAGRRCGGGARRGGLSRSACHTGASGASCRTHPFRFPEAFPESRSQCVDMTVCGPPVATPTAIASSCRQVRCRRARTEPARPAEAVPLILRFSAATIDDGRRRQSGWWRRWQHCRTGRRLLSRRLRACAKRCTLRSNRCCRRARRHACCAPTWSRLLQHPKQASAAPRDLRTGKQHQEFRCGTSARACLLCTRLELKLPTCSEVLHCGDQKIRFKASYLPCPLDFSGESSGAARCGARS